MTIRRFVTVAALLVAPACAVATVDDNEQPIGDGSDDDDDDSDDTGGTNSGTGGLVGGGATTGSGSATSGGGSGGSTGGAGGSSGGSTSGGGTSSGGGSGGGVGTGSCAGIPLFASWTTSDQYAVSTCAGGTPCTQGGGTAGQQYKFECTDSHKPNCQAQDPGTTNWGTPPWTLIEACE